VLSLVVEPEQAMVVMWLFEDHEPELLANGQSLGALLEVDCPSERGVADLLARRMLEIEGGGWTYTDFYGATRGPIEPTHDEVRAFVARCASQGVRLHYSDGTDPEHLLGRAAR
jgi:hypothetical protein